MPLRRDSPPRPRKEASHAAGAAGSHIPRVAAGHVPVWRRVTSPGGGGGDSEIIGPVCRRRPCQPRWKGRANSVRAGRDPYRSESVGRGPAGTCRRAGETRPPYRQRPQLPHRHVSESPPRPIRTDAGRRAEYFPPPFCNPPLSLSCPSLVLTRPSLPSHSRPRTTPVLAPADPLPFVDPLPPVPLQPACAPRRPPPPPPPSPVLTTTHETDSKFRVLVLLENWVRSASAVICMRLFAVSGPSIA